MVRRMAAFLALFPFTLPLAAHDPITTKLTWNREISRIFYRKCLVCHRDGARAMPLVTYDDARPWAKAIRDEVLERRMPPWGAMKGFGDFRNDSSLSEEEINWIVSWVEGGAPKGEEADLMPPPANFVTFQPPPTRRLRISGRLTRTVTVLGVETAATDLELIAELPDGTLIPLLRLFHRSANCPEAYYFSRQIRLPAGTRLTAPVTLLVAPAFQPAGRGPAPPLPPR